MQYEIKGTPLPVVICNVAENETMITDKGGMSWMTPNMEMSTNAGGSVGKAMSRMFSGESMFQNTYTARGGPGQIAFASSFPGEILAIPIGNGSSIVAQKSAFMASEATVQMSIHFQKKASAGFFGGEGFIMQRFDGQGMVFLEIDGSVVNYELQPGQSMLLDTGHLAAMDSTVQISVESVKGLGNKLFGGEGFFNTRVTGPGRIWLQTMPRSAIAAALSPYSTAT
ncbi:MAG: TIGR00266 family protein [Eubacterium sp.]|nr:TIGR00266 family protein [Eubacterium sp.]